MLQLLVSILKCPDLSLFPTSTIRLFADEKADDDDDDDGEEEVKYSRSRVEKL